jgi:enoyl-CoA hydratase
MTLRPLRVCARSAWFDIQMPDHSMTPDTDKMLARKEDGIGWLIFNNPERRNAISYEMRVATLAILDDFEADSAVRVIVMKGAGDKSFVSGSDISQFEKRMANADDLKAAEEIRERLQTRFDTLTKPLIAAVQGYCLGAGLSLALQADFCVAADNAVFGVPAARLGLAYSFVSTQRLVALIGPARTREMLYTARRFTASEALDYGLVLQVVPHAQLDDAARALAAAIAINAPLSVQAAKIMVKEALKGSGAADQTLCDAATATCLRSHDHAEGRKAFMEKRDPHFIGS